MYTELKTIISKNNNIVFFGGAGVSTESGLSDFRGVNGLHRKEGKYPPEVRFSHDFFIKNTEIFYSLYELKSLKAKPNITHIKLAELEKEGKLKAIITQNVDGLHYAAGSKLVLEFHGSIYRNYCMKCGKFHDVYFIVNRTGIPKCQCGGIVKPSVVLFGESPDKKVMKESVEYIKNADVLIIGGTSLVVYPAAGLIKHFKGSKLVLINKTPTPLDGSADLVINDSIGKVFESLFK